MATRIKLINMLQEVKGIAQITNRKPAPRPPFLYLVQLRSQSGQVETPRRRLAIEAEALRPPLPIKINHIKVDKTGLVIA